MYALLDLRSFPSVGCHTEREVVVCDTDRQLHVCYNVCGVCVRVRACVRVHVCVCVYVEGDLLLYGCDCDFYNVTS